MAEWARGRELPPRLAPLRELALDLRWTWSHGADELWRELAPELWAQTENPWIVLQQIPRARLEEVAEDAEFVRELERLDAVRRERRKMTGTFADRRFAALQSRVAYFCMEFGLGESLPLYAGGLGVLAGDHLKAASDLGIPLVGVGLLYQEGYFRQILGADHRQLETYPFNDPTSLPVQPALARDGSWLHVALDFPGRKLWLRVWCAQVGRVPLYLLDSNSPVNSPVDRGITGRLYDAAPERRLMQQIVLGLGGWRAVEALHDDVEVCHLNEGHAAFALLERARAFMLRRGVAFHDALWATRAGNVFTTHTAVSAALDRYEPALIREVEPYVRRYAEELGITPRELVGLGRLNPDDDREPFTMPTLAIRGSIAVNGVSALHAIVSRRIFAPQFPRWPEREVPITHVTNAVHVPTWDSPAADRLWERRCGKDRWMGGTEMLASCIAEASDAELWEVREENRRVLVELVRARLVRQLGYEGAREDQLTRARHVLDPSVLTIGFARRFTEYKRPALLLTDLERLIRLVRHAERPVQLVIAGKAHPQDVVGKALVRRWVEFARRPEVDDRVVFLADYDIGLAQELVRGADVWLNTPRRPWEASGTSGMKVLANCGLNLSTPDGWWAEAPPTGMGWTLPGDADDAAAASRLCELLEREIVPEFYERDEHGRPVRWIARVRASLAELAPRFSTNRMLGEYVTRLYSPAVERLQARAGDDARVARELAAWAARLRQAWSTMHFGAVMVEPDGDGWRFDVEVRFGLVEPSDVRVELYADAIGDGTPLVMPMTCVSPPAGERGACTFRACVRGRAPGDLTARVVPWHPQAVVPAEAPLILWQR